MVTKSSNIVIEKLRKWDIKLFQLTLVFEYNRWLFRTIAPELHHNDAVLEIAASVLATEAIQSDSVPISALIASTFSGTTSDSW